MKPQRSGPLRHGVRGTVALNSEVCDDYPQVVEDAVALGWELMGHNQSNARYLRLMSAEEERRVVLATFERIEKATGRRPRGWLSSGLQESWHTLDYLVEAGATYVADWINDDQPYLMNVGGQRLCSIPYSVEINDLPQILRAGRSSDEFERMIRRQFDTLYREGAKSGRVMAICLHPFIIGVPHRIGALDSALAYIVRHEGVWLPRLRGDVLRRHRVPRHRSRANGGSPSSRCWGNFRESHRRCSDARASISARSRSIVWLRPIAVQR